MNKRIRQLSRRAIIPLSVSVTALMSSVAMAEGSSAGFTLEEVVVTATKRAQSAQDIPMSVEAVSGEKLAEMSVVNMEDLSGSIPNFNVGDAAGVTQVTMRGMGSGVDRSFEQSVGMFVDGIYMPRGRQYGAPFMDAERVEVLRGPQAVLFGLNSTAGAVSVVSAKNRPGDALEGEVTAEHEVEYNTTSTLAVVGGSPIDSLGLRLAVKHAEQQDGYYENVFTGEDESDVRTDVARLTAVWEPTENLGVNLKYEYADVVTHGNIAEQFGGNCTDGTDCKLDWKRGGDAGGVPTINHGSGPGTTLRTNNLALSVDYDIGDYTLTTVAGYSEMEYGLAYDLDGGAAGILDAALYEEYEQGSLEVRLTSPMGKSLEYIVGAYAQSSNLDNIQPNLLLGIISGGSGFTQQQDLWSVFATATYNITESFRVTAGFRYNDEEKDIARSGECADPSNLLGMGLTTPSEDTCDTFLTLAAADPVNLGFLALVAPNNTDFEETVSSTNFMPELMAQWDVTGDIMLFGRLGKSAKSGGAGTAGRIDPDNVVYGDESVIGIEFGMKSRLADGAAELNVTIFRNEFEDLQVNSFTPDVVALISNAGEAVTQGIEVEGRWALAEWLTVGGSASWLDAEYTEYDPAPGNTSGVCRKDGSVVGTCDFDGQNLPFAADLSANVFADINYGLTESLNLVAGLDLYYSDEYFTDGSLDPVGLQDAYTTVNARIGVAAADDSWSVTLIGKNLTEEEVLTATQPLMGTYLGFINKPRTIALQGVYRFSL